MTHRQRMSEIWNGIRKKIGKKHLLAAILLAGLLLAPGGAKAQFGLDPFSIIVAGLSNISGLLQSVVAPPLAALQQVEQQAAAFKQQIVYPITAINNARALATQLGRQVRQMSQLSRLPVNSATLPMPQQLEHYALSHDPGAMQQISENYVRVYGGVMAPGQALEGVRDLVDMSDAEAQAALKKAVQLDALADIEMQAADQINQQLQTAAPGSAPILEAQAAAWLVRANACTQSAMAELVRVRSIDLANSSAQLKFNASDTSTLGHATSRTLGVQP